MNKKTVSPAKPPPSATKDTKSNAPQVSPIDLGNTPKNGGKYCFF